MPKFQEIYLGGIRLNPLDIEHAIDSICSWVKLGETGCVITVNSQHLSLYRESKEFQRACSRARLCLIDGKPVKWLAQMAYKKVFGYAPGSDLIAPLCKKAAEEDITIGIVGADRELAEKAGRYLKDQCKGLQLKGIWEAPKELMSNRTEAEDLAISVSRSPPDILLIGVGAPKQEIWADSYLDKSGARAILGVGAGLEFLLGVKKRAPRWIRKIGMEWGWRLAHEPSRLWFRYLSAARALFHVAVDLVKFEIRNE